ncbi:extracellular solute-binding protein [Haloterrigena sp. SYSU A558-1]|uniref:Extracellular solute-binding protein n=1 Tax=Haloterrigena gelatinilytica TaxID=2741724 RepID=A0A8J8GKY4_9EURY|nr:extracellular solute-binding protein [Haloterrigena gelatinilytica]NUB91924.1 extracellular solute-binding protein [Haloterrigena gelatinilytica]NUC72251.1 extracellular solute-binding protein [Haloterrigena gelatinilytica]
MVTRDDDARTKRGAGPSGGGRRAFLAAASATAAGVVGTAGCLGAADRVRVLSAGSLAVALEETVGPAFESETGRSYQGEYHGSTVVMRMIEERTKHPDVIVSADAELLRDRLYPDRTDWDVEFAANEVGIAYDPDTALGGRLAAGEPWYEVVADAGADDLAISDPDLDPLGYRAVQLFELAERRHDLEGFRETMLDTASREPDESKLLTGVEAGSRACAVVYRNMAVDHELPFRELPDAYNFGDPAHAETYATATYTTDEGYAARGRPAVYNATVRDDADNPDAGREFVSFLLEEPALLTDCGLRVGDALPRANGNVPEAIGP